MNSLFLSFVSVVLIFCSISYAQDDSSCKNDFRNFLKCVKDSKSDADRDARKKELQGKAEQCFKQAGCDAPDWNKDPTGGKRGRGGAGGFGQQIPESVKKCLQRKLVEKFGSKLNECLNKRGVKSVNFSEIANDPNVHSQFGGEHGGKQGLHGAMTAKFQAVKAVDKCADKKGGDPNSVKPLEQCLHDIKKDEKPRVCAQIKPCEAKASAACQKRGREVVKTLCLCKKEKEKEAAVKLRALAQQQQKIPMQDLVKTMADDQDIQDIAKTIDTCYAENGETEPPIIKMALALFGGSGGKGGAAGGKFGAAMSVNARTAIIMSDMLTLEANDEKECEPCA